MTAAAPAEYRLPAWRLAAAVLILGGMVLVLVSLAPVYLKDYELKRYFRDLAARQNAAAMTDEALRRSLAGKAGELGLPLLPGDVRIAREGGRLKMEMRYAVHFQLYQVDLHFHASATGR